MHKNSSKLHTKEGDISINITKQQNRKKSWVECVEYHIEWINVDHCIKKKFNKC